MAATIKQQITYPTGRVETFEARRPVSHVVVIQAKAGSRWEIWTGHANQQEAYKEAAELVGYAQFKTVSVLLATPAKEH